MNLANRRRKCVNGCMVKPRNGCLLTGFTVQEVNDLARYMLTMGSGVHCQVIGSDGETIRMGNAVDRIRMEPEGYRTIVPRDIREAEPFRKVRPPICSNG